jgi:hypothetical protein
MPPRVARNGPALPHLLYDPSGRAYRSALTVSTPALPPAVSVGVARAGVADARTLDTLGLRRLLWPLRWSQRRSRAQANQP